MIDMTDQKMCKFNWSRSYVKRNNSEAGPSYEKRLTEHLTFQRRRNRIQTSGFCKGVLHNMMLVNG